MGKDPADPGESPSGEGHQDMLHREEALPQDHRLRKLEEEVEIIRHCPIGGVLDREDSEVRLPGENALHRAPKALRGE